MYVFYQHHKDPSGHVLLTEMRRSSYSNRWKIAFNSPTEEAAHKACVIAHKTPPSAKRSYDDNTKVWTYFDDWGEKVIKQMETLCLGLGVKFSAIEVEDLAYLNTQYSFDYKKLRKPAAINPEDFFYNTAPPTGTSALTAEQIQKGLISLLEIPVTTLAGIDAAELKRFYRKAALRLHPDRNNGDGSKMSELNMLWGLYNG
jgi:hypothetical protein